MVVWLIIGALESAPSSPLIEQLTTASWFSIIALFGLSFIAINIARTISHASSSLAYSFRFTKLTPKAYLAALTCCASVIGVILVTLALGMTYGLFTASFGASMPPSYPLYAIGVSALVGVFMMAFAVLLMLVATNYLGLRSVNLIIFLPLLIITALGNLQMNSIIPAAAVYASPFNSIMSLLYESYSGTTAYTQLFNSSTQPLDTALLFLSIIVWTVALLMIDVVLLRKVKSAQLDDGRMM
ncbi:MAG TPA: hypothetical protein VLU38_04540 [Methanomassiliicoccales archaeon]|nr:hypothetical protein [Methanomassiliicoccales archaeon]